jgi:tRNA G18 (ribose-2'-O)-methylase SpoU
LRIEISDPDDPRIAVFQGLRDHVLRRQRELPGGDMAGFFIAEGDIVVERALRAGYRLESMLVDGKRTKPFPATIPDDVPLYACAPAVLQRITGYHLHRGALACFRRRQLLSFDDAVDEASTVVVLENINNPTNLGVILRCAAALDVDAFLLDPTCCDPLYRRSGRVSMGEAYSTPYARLGPFPDGLSPLKSAGFRLLALTPSPGAVSLDDLTVDPSQRVALMLGSEGPGLSDNALEAADVQVRIPMSGPVDSINVGSAAAVAFYGLRLARQRR